MASIFKAIKERDKKAFAQALKDNASLTARDRSGWTALDRAIEAGSTDFVRLLVAAGARVDVGEPTRRDHWVLVQAHRYARSNVHPGAKQHERLFERESAVIHAKASRRRESTLPRSDSGSRPFVLN